MQLYLIRHGQSTNNILEDAARRDQPGIDKKERVADTPLTETGTEQARLLARHLQTEMDKTDARDRVFGKTGYGLERIFCSPMLRTLQTAQPIADATGLKPEVWTDIFEEGGIWFQTPGEEPDICPGMNRAEINDSFPSFLLPDSISDSGWWNRPKETRNECTSRVARVAEHIRSCMADTDQRIALVSHGTFLSFLTQQLLFGKVNAAIHIRIHNTGITRFDISSERAALCYENRLEHLPPSLIT